MGYTKSVKTNWLDKIDNFLIVGAEEVSMPKAMRLYDVMILANENTLGYRQGVKITDFDGKIVAIRYVDGIDEMPNELPEESIQFIVGTPKRCFVWCQYKE